MARGEQLGRQWKILQVLLGARNGRSVSELAREVSCHLRTVYRDLEALQFAGFPLYTEQRDGKNRWMLLDADRRKTPLPLDLTELMALYLSRAMMRGLKNTFFAEALESLFDKIRAMLPPQSVEYLERAQQTLGMSSRPFTDAPAGGGAVEQIQEAIVNRSALDIVYYTMSRRQESRRRVDPYKIWFFDGAFYLIAYCRQRNDVRIFAIDRIQELASTEESFEKTGDFDPDRFMEASFGVFAGPPVSVKIRFARQVAGYIQERMWHPDQVVKAQPDGSVDFEATVSGTEEIKAWILGWGRHAEVLRPVSLRRQVAEEIRILDRRYRERQPTASADQ